jgi:hypothetical protein
VPASVASAIDRAIPSVNSALVAEYRRAHEELLAAIRAMDGLALGTGPNPLRVSHTRMRITRAANESRAAFQKIVLALSQKPSPTIAGKVEVLTQLHAELKEVARRHMATWTHAAAQEDWPGFCKSHAYVAQRWCDTIARERQLLYPIL